MWTAVVGRFFALAHLSYVSKIKFIDFFPPRFRNRDNASEDSSSGKTDRNLKNVDEEGNEVP